MAPTIKAGDIIPEATFSYVPYSPELDSGLACGTPVQLNIHKEWKGKKVVLFAVPGAFTPTCHVNHLPPYLERFDEFKSKGVDVIAVLAGNDAFVMSGWSRFTGLKDKILALSDANAEWSKKHGLGHDRAAERTGRWAIILDDLKVQYIEIETAPGVTVSGADAVLAKL
ncbi:peroxiredoxin type-2 [Marasmius tenuissimus]|uniref:Peroxiredoxin type-2 n=1 Tax=Marasmius tenuissimus TaxID=585030 RepID=A0ABR3AA75_9AGAR|nr:peroxiredoxin type-2 [Marasmius tenuissimus]